MTTSGVDPRYFEGIDLFNRGDYFAAHEVWEELWLEAAAADRRFYQSLIQAAVALYHLGTGNRGGAERLYARGRAKMQAYRPRHLGIDVEALWAGMEAALAGAAPPQIAVEPPGRGDDHER